MNVYEEAVVFLEKHCADISFNEDSHGEKFVIITVVFPKMTCVTGSEFLIAVSKLRKAMWDE